MAVEKQRFWLTFNAEAAQQPLICLMARRFDVVFNIHNASVTQEVGIIAVGLEGEREVIKQAVAWLEGEGVQVEPVEINTIEG
jgi:ABC-type methionine transport system ATPase subunit